MGALAMSLWTTWGIAAAATAGVIVRPFAWPEWVWAVAGAALLVLLGLLPASDALAGIGKGTDVYLFLVGMMLLAELARQEGLFDWLAAKAARLARGSATRLFRLVFLVGTVVTTFLSNDATAVVLTPAVAAVAKAADAKQPLPYLFICAFIANAASFVLPISNPANLVIYGAHMPPLLKWLPRYALPSLLAILATYAVLRWTQRAALRQEVSSSIEVPSLSAGGKAAAAGIAGTAAVLLASSAFGVELGLPTFLSGLATAALVLLRSKCSPVTVLRQITWGVLPLVAGLFVLVKALERTGVTRRLADLMHALVQHSTALAAWGAGVALAVGCNLVNNLPAGLVAGRVAKLADLPERVRAAVLIGVDRGGSGAEPVRHRVAGHHPVANGLAPRGSGRRRVAILEARRVGDAHGAAARPCGRIPVRLIPTSTWKRAMQNIGAAWLYPIILVCGALQAWGPPMNGALRQALSNPWLASMVSFLPILFFLAVVFFCQPRPLPTGEGVGGMPWWAPLGGLIGAFVVVAGLLFVEKSALARSAG